MKGNALSLALITIAGSLAGCLATDSDGVPEISLTDEDITGLFDDYFMDFVNNSSVTVVNEIHYHNNTTVIEGDDSSTNSVVYNSNGSGASDYPYYILDVTFDADYVSEDPIGSPDYSLVYFNATWSYYDSTTGDYQQGIFSVSCGNYWLLVDSGSPNNSPYWDNQDYYYDAWMNIHNQTIINILDNYASDSSVQQTCGAYHWYQNNQDWLVVYEHSITIPEGFVLSCTGGVNAGGVYQIAYFYRSDSWVGAHGTTPPDASTWFEWGRGGGHNWVSNPSDGNSRYQQGIDADMSVDEFPHHCGRFAGNGGESEFKLTVTFDSALEVRVLFYYQLIPIQAVLQSD